MKDHIPLTASQYMNALMMQTKGPEFVLDLRRKQIWDKEDFEELKLDLPNPIQHTLQSLLHYKKFPAAFITL
jgi:hypothetical protein